MVEKPDWKTANKELVQEAVRQADLRLENQVRLAISADQRAAVLAGIYTAASAALFAGVLSVFTDGQTSLPIVLGGSIAALMFIIGAALCIFTGLPKEFDVPGNDPENWYDDIIEDRAINLVLGEVAGHLQDGITENRRILKRNGYLYRLGALIGVAAPLVGILVWIIANG